MKKLVIPFAAAVLALGTAFAVANAPAAHASGCDSSDFYMNSQGSPGLNIFDEGHNNKVQMQISNSTCFNLIGIGGGWFEFEDNNNECLNTGSDQYIYFDSCTGSTPEQFTSASGSHEWTNRHFGGNDFLQTDVSVQNGYVFVQPLNPNLVPYWDTPAA